MDSSTCSPPRYVYGPVPSRRLGRSLGVDLVPLKRLDHLLGQGLVCLDRRGGLGHYVWVGVVRTTRSSSKGRSR